MTEREIQQMRYEIAASVAEGRSCRSVAAEYGVSHQTVLRYARRLLERVCSRLSGNHPEFRFKRNFRDCLATGKTGPKNVKCPVRDAIRDRIVKAKSDYPGLGARKLALIAGVKASAPTVMKTLREAGMLSNNSKAKRVRMEKEFSNCMWQIDFTILGNELGTGKSVYFLSVLDDYSRKIMMSDVTTEPMSEYVTTSLDKCIIKHGKPYQILSDHGIQWYSGNGWSDFDAWCSENGIEHITGMFMNPKTSGKVERWHRTLKSEVRIPKAARLCDYGALMCDYVETYNNVRPHMAKRYETPEKAFAEGIDRLRKYIKEGIVEKHLSWIVETV